MRVTKGPVLGILTLTLCCASSPEMPALDRARIRSIESGVTTRAQIEEWFGPPTDEVIKSWEVLWRYERRFVELERPGPVRKVLCGTIGQVPILPFPLFLFGGCQELERLEKLKVRFTPEFIVASLEFEDDLRRVDDAQPPRRRPFPYPCPSPSPYPYPCPMPTSGPDVASAERP